MQCLEFYLKFNKQKHVVPEGGLEPPIFGLGDRRLIHWATRALLMHVKRKIFSKCLDLLFMHKVLFMLLLFLPHFFFSFSFFLGSWWFQFLPQ